MNFKYQIKKSLEIRNYKQGFTLVEMLIYMGMLSIILAVLSEIFVTILDVQLESEATSSVEQDNRYIFSRLIYDINRTDKDNIILPATLGDSGDTLEMNIDDTNYTYSLNPNGNFEITDNTGTTYQLNSFDTVLSNLTFQRLGNIEGNNSIRINFTITGKTQKPGGLETRNFETTIGTR